MTEQELLKLSEVAKKHLGKVLSRLGIPKSSFDKNDLLQEFLLAIWEGKAVVPEGLSTDKLNAWTYCVLRNITINKLKLNGSGKSDTWHNSINPTLDENGEDNAQRDDDGFLGCLSREDDKFNKVERDEDLKGLLEYLSTKKMRTHPGLTYADVLQVRIDEDIQGVADYLNVDYTVARHLINHITQLCRQYLKEN